MDLTTTTTSEPAPAATCRQCGGDEWEHRENFRFSTDTCAGCGYRVNVRHRHAYDDRGRRIQPEEATPCHG